MDNDLKAALGSYLDTIKADYFNWQSKPGRTGESDEIRQKVRADMLKEFNEAICYEEGSKYIRVITGSKGSRSAHSFIVKQDDSKFKKGDILKTAGWKAPAKNQARGNIFGTYHVQWEGADYLR